MGRPGEHHLRTLTRLVLLDGDEIGKALQGVTCGTLEADDWHACIGDKLFENRLLIVMCTVGKAGKRAQAQHIAVLPHHRGRLLDVLGGGPVHHHPIARLKRPRVAAGIQNDRLCTQQRGSLLRAHARAKRRVHKQQAHRAPASKSIVAPRISCIAESAIHGRL